MTNAEARFNKSLRPRKPEGSLGRTAQDIHLDSHTAPELWSVVACSRFWVYGEQRYISLVCVCVCVCVMHSTSVVPLPAVDVINPLKVYGPLLITVI